MPIISKMTTQPACYAEIEAALVLFATLGEPAEFSNRWRYRLMVEREFAKGRASVVPYINVEPYYDSRYETVNRIRWINGATVAWSPRYAVEGNVTYQHDTRSSVTTLLALNVIVHLYFESRRSLPPAAPVVASR